MNQLQAELKSAKRKFIINATIAGSLLVLAGYQLCNTAHAQDEVTAFDPEDTQIMGLLIHLQDQIDALQPQSAELDPPKSGRTSTRYIPTPTEDLSVSTRVYDVPAGMKVIRVKQAPKYIITEYLQPDTFKLVPIRKKAVIKKAVVGALNEGKIQSILNAKSEE